MRPSDLDLRLAVTDAPVGELPEMVNCPEHTDTERPNLAVYREHVHCYGCGCHAKGFFALALLLFGQRDEASMRRAMGVAPRYTAQSLDAYRDRVQQQVKLDPLPRGLAIAYTHLLQTARKSRLDWLFQRGLTLDTIQQFYIGHDGNRFVLPVFDKENKLLTLRFRRDDFYGTHTFDPRRGKEVAIPKYSGMRGRNGTFLFPAWEIEVEEPNTLVVVEGELDAVRLWQEGVPAVSATNGAGSVAKLPALIREQFPQMETLFFACDQDEAGDEANYRGVLEAARVGFKAQSLEWPVEWGCKDITEVLLTHSLEEAGWMLPKPA